MRTRNILVKDGGERRYQAFKGYAVPLKTKKSKPELHFVVPWELDHKDEKAKLVF